MHFETHHVSVLLCVWQKLLLVKNEIHKPTESSNKIVHVLSILLHKVLSSIAKFCAHLNNVLSVVLLYLCCCMHLIIFIFHIFSFAINMVSAREGASLSLSPSRYCSFVTCKTINSPKICLLHAKCRLQTPSMQNIVWCIACL